ncbi:MAG: calcium-binding protein [Actinomycetota bacterium]
MSSLRGWAVASLLFVSVLVPLSLAGPASAGRVQAASISVGGAGVLRFRSATGLDDDVSIVSFGPHRLSVHSRQPLEAGRRCHEATPGEKQLPYLVRCRGVAALDVALRDGSDTLSVSKILFLHGSYRVGAGNDTVYGGGGAEHLVGGSGEDSLFGGIGNDVVSGGAGDDVVVGGRRLRPARDGDDRLRGGPGSDLLRGGEGDDALEGDDGDDRLDGGTGNDHFVGERGADVVIPSTGVNTIDYSARTVGVSLTDDGVANDGAPGEGDDIERGFHLVIAGSGDDTVAMSEHPVVIMGNGGDDDLRLMGNGGIYGGPGDDTLTKSGAFPARVRGEAGDDHLVTNDASADTDACGPGQDDVTATRATPSTPTARTSRRPEP